MKIGVLVTSVGDYGNSKFYNSQEVGLAKALDVMCDQVVVYKAVSIRQKKNTENIAGTRNAAIVEVPVQAVGINGLWNCSVMDTDIDCLVCFSDTQLSVPRISRWCKKHKILLIFYIGTFESHSTSAVKRHIMNCLFKRNLEAFKKNKCLAKTQTVEKELKDRGVQSIQVAPIGLDLTLLHENYKTVLPDDLKIKYGFKKENKIILFIGRLIEEKQPVHMIRIFSELYKADGNYRLLMVGQGSLEENVRNKIRELKLATCVKHIKRIPNSEIWELYRLADCYVNLNQQEIFGMAILEAMYYGCKVVAWRAPGPEVIIEDGVSGYLVDSDEMLYSRVLNADFISENGKKRVMDYFTWENSANSILKLISAQM